MDLMRDFMGDIIGAIALATIIGGILFLPYLLT